MLDSTAFNSKYPRVPSKDNECKCYLIASTNKVKHYLIFYFFACSQNACGAKIGICRALLNKPDVVSIGIVWDSERPAAEQVHSVLKAVGTSLRLGDVFHQVSDTRWAHAN